MAACYRLYAANCIELAERNSNVERRIFLLHMARDWLKLAVQVEQAEFGDHSPRTPYRESEPGPPMDRPEPRNNGAK